MDDGVGPGGCRVLCKNSDTRTVEVEEDDGFVSKIPADTAHFSLPEFHHLQNPPTGQRQHWWPGERASGEIGNPSSGRRLIDRLVLSCDYFEESHFAPFVD